MLLLVSATNDLQPPSIIQAVEGEAKGVIIIVNKLIAFVTSFTASAAALQTDLNLQSI